MQSCNNNPLYSSTVMSPMLHNSKEPTKRFFIVKYQLCTYYLCSKVMVVFAISWPVQPILSPQCIVSWIPTAASVYRCDKKTAGSFP